MPEVLYRALVVEDDPDAARFVRTVLERRAGMDVVVAGDAETALGALAAGGLFDLMVIDIELDPRRRAGRHRVGLRRGVRRPPLTAAMADSLQASGRGLAIAQAALDELSYERAHGPNRWRMVRLRHSSSRG